MAGIRRWATRATRPIRISRRLTWTGRKAYAKMSVRKIFTTLSPGTARTGRRIAIRRQRQYSALKHIK